MHFSQTKQRKEAESYLLTSKFLSEPELLFPLPLAAMVSHSLSLLSPISCNSLTTISSDSPSFYGAPRGRALTLRLTKPKELRTHRKPLFSASLSLEPPSFLGPSSLEAAEVKDGSREQFVQNDSIGFLRFRKGVDGGELQTSVVSYRLKFPRSIQRPALQVDLVSMVHVADKGYFENLQKMLEPYDSVLYEMVKFEKRPENDGNPAAEKKLKSFHLPHIDIVPFIQKQFARFDFDIGLFIQEQFARFGSLEYQGDCLDYEGDNWYNADLDYQTIKLLQAERGESFFPSGRDKTTVDLGPWRSKLLWVSQVLSKTLTGLLMIGVFCVTVVVHLLIMGYVGAFDRSRVSEYPELGALSRLDFGTATKFVLAKMMDSAYSILKADVKDNSVLVGERNRVATEVLRREIDEGKNRIAIIYGGGHMHDLCRRLTEEFDLVPAQVQWVTAWSLKNR